MKAFIIIMLSVSILGCVLSILDYIKKEEGIGIIIGVIFLSCFVLALVFTCNL